jgi:hypothetical protein
MTTQHPTELLPLLLLNCHMPTDSICLNWAAKTCCFDEMLLCCRSLLVDAHLKFGAAMLFFGLLALGTRSRKAKSKGIRQKNFKHQSIIGTFAKFRFSLRSNVDG